MFFEEDTRWKLMDFDSARMVNAEMHGAFTVAYAPPEVVCLTSEEEADKLTIQKSIDMWAFGILTYEVLTGIQSAIIPSGTHIRVLCRE